MAFFPKKKKAGTALSNNNKEDDVDVEALSEATSELSISRSAPGSSCNDNSQSLVSIMKRLRNKLTEKLKSHVTDDDQLKNEIPFKGSITKIINPLEYAWLLHEEYLTKRPTETRILFVGMNPSTASLTGIPFYDENMMNALIGEDELDKIFKTMPPDIPRKKTPESGARFWKFMSNKFGSYKMFFEQCFVINYCPLIFVNQKYGNVALSIDNFNKSNDKLLQDLMEDCDDALEQTIQATNPGLIVGIGIYTFNRVETATKTVFGANNNKTLRMTHPSPIANPRYDEWSNKVASELEKSAIWRNRKRNRSG